MRITSMLAAIAVLFSFGFYGCTDDTTAPTTNLGKSTIAEFRQNAGYAVWYDAGYNAYPEPAAQSTFQSAVDRIAARLNESPGEYTMILVVKPSCGCEHTQTEMPKVMKTLDEAGFSHDNVEVWITDRPLNGIDDVKDRFGIDTAPTFLLVKSDAEVGRVEVDEISDGAEIAVALADIFDLS